MGLLLHDITSFIFFFLVKEAKEEGENTWDEGGGREMRSKQISREAEVEKIKQKILGTAGYQI